MDRNDTISVLNGLIETCRDGQYGFQEAAEYVTRPDLKEFFNATALERARFVGELQQEVRSLGAEPDNEGSTAGTLHRAWIDIKGTLTGKDDENILAECERGEDSAVETYKDALLEDLPVNIRSTIELQSFAIRRTHDHVKDLRDRAREGATRGVL